MAIKDSEIQRRTPKNVGIDQDSSAHVGPLCRNGSGYKRRLRPAYGEYKKKTLSKSESGHQDRGCDAGRKGKVGFAGLLEVSTLYNG